MWSKKPLFSLNGGLVHPKCFQLCLSLVIGGGGGKVDDVYVVCVQKCSGGPCPMDWSTIIQELHSSVVSQQWNDIHIQQ